jgi:arylsulfatase
MSTKDASNLPLPTPPFRGRIGNTYVDSEADVITLPRAPAGAPTCCWCCSTMSASVRRARSADQRTRRRCNGWPIRAALQPLSHHGALLAVAAALLSGRNHHSVHTGVITEMATGFPGYDGSWPRRPPASRKSSGAITTARRPSGNGTTRLTTS